MNSSSRIVSSEAEELILVDDDDNEIGHRSKAECHDGDGLLHRAFSLFLFDDAGDLLLQRRARTKRLWPGYWSNSCCSHPRRGETLEVATKRRLRDELNVEAELEFVYKFSYAADFGDQGSERELCHVFLGAVESDVRPNELEIADVRFVSVAELSELIRARPAELTPWFKMEWQTLSTMHRDVLDCYAAL